MQTIFTVGSLAKSYADKKMVGRDADESPRLRTQAHNRFAYNFAATGFNISTIASIAAVAAAIIINSPLTLILALLVCGVRHAFKEGAEKAALSREDAPGLFVMNLDDLNDEVKTNLGIESETWTAVKAKLLSFRIWMSTTPAPVAAAVAVASNARAERAQSNRNEQVYHEEIIEDNDNNNNNNYSSTRYSQQPSSIEINSNRNFSSGSSVLSTSRG